MFGIFKQSRALEALHFFHCCRSGCHLRVLACILRTQRENKRVAGPVLDCAILSPSLELQYGAGITATDHIPTSILKMNSEHISETLVSNYIFTQLRARENFIAQTGSFHHFETLAEMYNVD
jgi:hypothetical protein